MNKKIYKELNNQKQVIQCARRFGLVGDATRMKICWLLCHHKELSVSQIAEILGVSVSVVSHSLKKLKQAQMVKSRQQHKHVFYALTNNNFNKFLKTNLPNVKP